LNKHKENYPILVIKDAIKELKRKKFVRLQGRILLRSVAKKSIKYVSLVTLGQYEFLKMSFRIKVTSKFQWHVNEAARELIETVLKVT